MKQKQENLALKNLARQPPSLWRRIMTRKQENLVLENSARRPPSLWRRIWSNTGASIGLTMLTIIILVALFGPMVVPYDPIALDLNESYQPPSWRHPFGTDALGRDVLSRVVSGAGISFKIVILVLVTAIGIGAPLGALAGYLGGMADEVVMRVADIFLAFPSFLLAMAITAALGQSLNNAVVAVAITLWPVYGRLVRAQILSVKNEPYVEAARAVGSPPQRILLWHILPNSVAPVLVQSALHAGNAILMTAALSFVGLGAAPPTPEWGAMVSEARRFMTNYWWMPLFPGLAIAFCVAGYMYLGDGLRDVLDPRLRERMGP